MPRNRHTIEELDKEIAVLEAQDPVFKVDVDHVKYTLSRVYDNERDAVGEEFTHGGKWQDLTKEEYAFDLPFELRHLYGKKAQKALADLPETPYVTAIKAMAERMKPRHEKVQALIARQTKGRKPSEPKEVIATRTQMRGICPCCFKEHAVKGDKLVAHGYTLDYGFQNGTCMGAGKSHFGTPAGRDVCAEVAISLRAQADDLRDRAQRTQAREMPVYQRAYRNGRYENVEVKDPSDLAVNHAAESLRRNAEMIDRMAEERDDLVKKWKPTEAREVEVEVTA